MSTLDEILGLVAGLDTYEECAKVRKAADARLSELRSRDHQRRVTERWTKLERCKPGTVLYLAHEGITIGGSLQRGDSIRVVRVDREAERMYIQYHRVRGKLVRAPATYVIDPAWLERFKLQREKPDKPASDDDRRLGAAVAKAFEGVEEG